MKSQIDQVKHLRVVHFGIISTCIMLLITAIFEHDKNLDDARKQIAAIDDIVSEWEPFGLTNYFKAGHEYTNYRVQVNRMAFLGKDYFGLKLKDETMYYRYSFKSSITSWAYLNLSQQPNLLDLLYVREHGEFYRPTYRIKKPGTISEWKYMWNSIHEITAGVLWPAGPAYFCDASYELEPVKYQFISKFKSKPKIDREIKKNAKAVNLKLLYNANSKNKLGREKGFEAGYFLLGEIENESTKLIVPLKFRLYDTYQFSGQMYFRTLIEGEAVEPHLVFFGVRSGEKIYADEERYSFLSRRIPIGEFEKSFRELAPYAQTFSDFRIPELRKLVDYISQKSRLNISVFGISVPLYSIHITGAVFTVFLQLYFFLFISTIRPAKIAYDIEALYFPWMGVLPGLCAKVLNIASFAVLPFGTIVFLQVYSLWADPYFEWDILNWFLLSPVALSGLLAMLTIYKYNRWMILDTFHFGDPNDMSFTPDADEVLSQLRISRKVEK